MVMWTMNDYSDIFIDARERMIGQAEVTKGLWQDEVQKRFYEQHVDPAIEAVRVYLTESKQFEYVGKGLKELTDFVNEKVSEFNSI